MLQALTSVDAAHNGLDGIAATMIANALAHDNRGLTALELSHNPLGRQGTEQIMAALTQSVSEQCLANESAGNKRNTVGF